MPPGGQGVHLPGMSLSGHPDFSRSLSALGSLVMEASTGGFLLQAGRLLKGSGAVGVGQGTSLGSPLRVL